MIEYKVVATNVNHAEKKMNPHVSAAILHAIVLSRHNRVRYNRVNERFNRPIIDFIVLTCYYNKAF